MKVHALLWAVICLSASVRGEITVTASLEWLADHCIDSGIYVVSDSELGGDAPHLFRFTLQTTLRGTPAKETEWTCEGSHTKIGEEFLICFQHYTSGEKRIVQIINLDRPQVVGSDKVAVTCELKLLKAKAEILKVFRERLKSHPKADPVEISDYSKDNRFELSPSCEVFRAVWGGSSCYLRIPGDLVETAKAASRSISEKIPPDLKEQDGMTPSQKTGAP